MRPWINWSILLILTKVFSLTSSEWTFWHHYSEQLGFYCLMCQLQICKCIQQSSQEDFYCKATSELILLHFTIVQPVSNSKQWWTWAVKINQSALCNNQMLIQHDHCLLRLSKLCQWILKLDLVYFCHSSALNLSRLLRPTKENQQSLAAAPPIALHFF